jgi:tetratricopeptide (TPR) repeat protein
VARHLLSCPACRGTALGALQPAADDGARSPHPSKVLRYRRRGAAAASGAQEVLGERLRAVLRSAAREVEAGEPLIDELRRQPRKRWALLVRNHPRFRTVPVVQAVLAEARESLFREAARTVELAELALWVLDRLDPSTYTARLLDDLRARAWSWLGTGLRLGDDLEGAERAFRRAELLLQGSSDGLELGRFAQLLAGLRKDQRRFDEARAMLRRAVELFRGAGDPVCVARALTTLGSIYLDEGSPSEALAPLLEALDRVDDAEDARTAAYARNNLALCLAELGEYEAAKQVFEENREMYARSAEPYLTLRARWLEGLIAAGCGDDELAEARFRDLHASYLASGQAYDAALVSLDLAQLLVRQGRAGELVELTVETSGTFLALGIHREAAAALAFFRRAVEQRTVSVELVAAVARFLKRSRLRPDLHFDGAA